MKDDTKLLTRLQPDCAVFRGVWRDVIHAAKVLS